MARKSTSSVRPDTHDTAAYAASQPLFDSIRNAIAALDRQKVNLGKARDIVQHIHVLLPDEHVDNNGLLHENYVDGLLGAWSSATEGYCSVFEQLCAINGPDPATGKEAQEGYEGYKKILDSAKKVNEAVKEHSTPLKKRPASEDKDDARAKEQPASSNKKHKKSKTLPVEEEIISTPSAPVSAKRAAAVADPSPAQDSPRPNKKQRTVPVQTPNTLDRPIKKAKSQGPRQQRKARQRGELQTPRPPPSTTSLAPTPPTLQAAAPTPPAVHQAEPVVYADVSAEVDARLAAKEAAKRAKKEAKKRKRESQGSNIVEAEAGAEREAIEAHEKRLAEKPAKKRSKRVDGEGLGSAKKIKRESEGEGGDGGSKKKRKKVQ